MPFSSGFMVQGEITNADTPTVPLGATPSRQISNPPPSSPPFPATTLPVYPGTGTKYAGLHTQWLGYRASKFMDIQ